MENELYEIYQTCFDRFTTMSSLSNGKSGLAFTELRDEKF
jgi:hypothetical protein